MINSKISHEQLLAIYWLNNDTFHGAFSGFRNRLRAFIASLGLDVPESDFEEVATKLEGRFVNGDPDGWVTLQCFYGHPHTVWNFIIDAVAVAENEDQLARIAAGPAEHLLAYYGSLIPLFEKQAKQDQKFARMLTGVWRHKMCDEVWNRLRKIQTGQQGLDGKPFRVLPEDWMSDTLSEEDRTTRDKGGFQRTAEGQWEVRKAKPGFS